MHSNIFSASYGLELGSVGPAARVDWRKHILDARHQFWYSLGNHHLLDLESRFTLGRLRVPGKVPLPERFFGGNNEEFLIASDNWQIRANPVIRAIPGSRFFQTAEGAGGREFFSYNFTAAYGIWRQTLVPEELTTDDDFKSELEGCDHDSNQHAAKLLLIQRSTLRECRDATACCADRAARI